MPKLSDDDNEKMWDRFFERFYLRDRSAVFRHAGMGDAVLRALRPPRDAAERAELEGTVLAALRALTKPGERIFALDWQHDGWWFEPHGDASDLAAFVFPDGDCFILLPGDLRFGYHARFFDQVRVREGEWTLALSGAAFIERFEPPPAVFGEVIAVEHLVPGTVTP